LIYKADNVLFSGRSLLAEDEAIKVCSAIPKSSENNKHDKFAIFLLHTIIMLFMFLESRLSRHSRRLEDHDDNELRARAYGVKLERIFAHASLALHKFSH
jgi:hypothetical protein